MRVIACVLSVLVLFCIEISSSGVHLAVSSNWEETPLVFELAEAISYLPGPAFLKFLQNYTIGDLSASNKMENERAWDLAKNLTTQEHHHHMLQYSVASRYYNPTIVTHLDLAELDFHRFSDQNTIKQTCDAKKVFAILTWRGVSEILFEEEQPIFQQVKATEENEGNDASEERKEITTELMFCDPHQLKTVIDFLVENLAELRSSVVNLEVNLPHEHLLGSRKSSLHVLLYGDFTNPEFQDFQFLLDYVNDSTKAISVVYRYTTARLEGTRVSLQGFGAELALKNTEYRTVDDSSTPNDENIHEEIDPTEVLQGINFHQMISKKPELEGSLRELRDYLKSSNDDIRPLKRWEMTDLSLQAAYAASQSDNPWQFLTDLTGNFPSLATSLATVKINEPFRESMKQENGFYGLGKEFATLNGRPLDLDELNPFDLYKIIQQELELYDILELIDIPPNQIKDVMTMELPNESEYRFDLRTSLVHWLNNIETDPAYSQWPSSLYELFKPNYPDQLRFIRKNLINAVIVVDPLSEDAFAMYSAVEMYIRGKAPLRIAFLFRGSNENHHLGDIRVPPSSLEQEWDEPLEDVFIACYNHVYQNKGASAALSFLSKIAKHQPEEISLADLDAALGSISLESVYNTVHLETADAYLEASAAYFQTSGLQDAGSVIFLNGVPFTSYPFTNGGITAAVREFIQNEYPLLQKKLWQRQLQEGDDIYDVLLTGKGVYSIYNSLVVHGELSYTPLEAITMPIANERRSYRLASKVHVGLGEFLLKQIDFINGKHPKGSNEFIDITHLLLLDLSTQQGIRTLVELGKRFDFTDEETQKDTVGVRFGVLHNSGCATGEGTLNFEGSPCFTLYNDLASIAGRIFSYKKYLKFIQFVMPHFMRKNEERQIDIIQEIRDHVRCGTPKEKQFIELYNNQPWRTGIRLVHEHLISEVFQGQIVPGRNYIVTNGRVTEIPEDLEYFPPSGFRLLEAMEREKIQGLYEIVAKADYQHVIDQEPFQSIGKQLKQFRCELLLRLSSIMLHRQHALQRYVYIMKDSQESDAKLSFHFILDPLSKSTRRLAPIMNDLLQTFDNSMIHVDLKFNPTPDLSELPLTSYYRYGIHTASIDYDTEGFTLPHAVTFTELPSRVLFSLHIDAAPSWMVQSRVSQYDLDNIMLTDISEEFLFAEFELQSLVIQGSVYDKSELSAFPRGTELVLRNSKHESERDTIVMANLGYFQLQANPGVWFIDVAPGRSSQVYAMEHAEEPMIVSSFSVPYQRKFVMKKEGMEDVSVLDVPVKKQRHDQTIHVFSLASGHVYERFLKIMMLSVMRNSDSPVKFWFVENFLSPKFKSSLEDFSKQYSFEVELISYQWPQWLHAQTEKQRVIWAYKILFLDVLFPLDVHRVIFVDADLVVRGDLRELNELDLQGAPYAYTPFCDSREEMEGFRFWKTGFWNDHLTSINAKYHISALYVVDLDNFRNNAIGDILRSVYSNLSKDRNSLANLDQDLPNFTQTNIPIYSLDESWLWCETWCSDESKVKAKAIDLCNNPMTKTPKLENAVRIIDEWTELDQEAKSVQILEENLRSINPIHTLLARNVSESWIDVQAFLQTIEPLVDIIEPEENEAEEQNSWFGELMEDII